jgi:hypothetical protein
MNEGLQLGRASLIWDVLISCAQAGRTITYKELAQKVDTHYRALGHALELIQKHCEIQKLPSLTSKPKIPSTSEVICLTFLALIL